MTTPEETASAAKTSDGETDVEREVRFAVVMYGGVSLAIYINGVTQELLRMVRATARANPQPSGDRMLFAREELSASEKVYRDVAKLLDKKAGFKNAATDVTRTRFIVDVISG